MDARQHEAVSPERAAEGSAEFQMGVRVYKVSLHTQWTHLRAAVRAVRRSRPGAFVRDSATHSVVVMWPVLVLTRGGASHATNGVRVGLHRDAHCGWRRFFSQHSPDGLACVWRIAKRRPLMRVSMICAYM